LQCFLLDQQLIAEPRQFSVAVQVRLAELQQFVETGQDGAFVFLGRIGFVEFEFPLVAQEAHQGVDGGEDKPQLCQGIAQFMGDGIGCLEPLAGQLFPRSQAGFPKVEGQQFGAERARKLLDHAGETVAPMDGMGLKMDLDHGHHDVFGFLPDRLAAAVQRVVERVGIGPVKVRLLHQDRFHVMTILDLTAQLLPHTAKIIKGIVGGPAFLLLDAPSHGFERMTGTVPVLLPCFPRGIVVGLLRQTPLDPTIRFAAGSDSHCLQARHGADGIDGPPGGLIETTEDRLDGVLTGYFQKVPVDFHCILSNGDCGGQRVSPQCHAGWLRFILFLPRASLWCRSGWEVRHYRKGGIPFSHKIGKNREKL